MAFRASKKTFEDVLINAIVLITLIVTFVACLYPFYLSIVLSFNDGVDAQLGGIYFWPRKFTFQNYMQFFSDIEWRNGIWISLSRTVVGTFFSVFFTAIVAYGLAHKNLVGRKIYMSLIIVSMYFSGGIIPYYTVLTSLRTVLSRTIFG
jgi:putative aldouronate transport system permease protein